LPSSSSAKSQCDPRLPRRNSRPGDKGLLITTGTFTADAKREATRDGVPPIDLIDVDRLCGLLKDYGLGVRTQVREVEDVEVDAAIFEEI
jgi:restriction system protein